MEYLEKLKKVSVLGAAGKMGSGILLLTAMEMTENWLVNKDLKMELLAVDLSSSGLKGLLRYLESQVLKAAEKKMVLLRKLYHDRSDLIENGDIIAQYVKDVLGMVATSTHLEDARGSSLVFEAIKEDPDVKVPVLKSIDADGDGNCWFFTNTSSIPISRLDDEANLGGRIVGFHFYNPPAVQKLVELIPSKNTKPELTAFARKYASNLKKVLVPSNDFAGFIGNGHFMRDALYGIEEVEKLSKSHPFAEAIWIINRISQDFLLRPMGIFQLIDYVGVDVVSYIMQVMNPYLPDEDLHSPLLDQMLQSGVKGGQFSDGSQKDGILRYEKGRPVAVFDIVLKNYVPVSDLQSGVDGFLGSLPEELSWKQVNFSGDKKSKLDDFFGKLSMMENQGAVLARLYGKNSCRIGKFLVSSGVALSENDVNKVLETGFFHAYGPVNEYFNV